MMVGYIVEVIFVINVANNNTQLWGEAEHALDDKTKYYEAFTQLQNEQRNPRVWCKWTRWGRGSCCCGRGGGEPGLFTLPSRAHRIVSFDRLKARFIQQANKHHGRLHGSTLGSSFMLSHYLSVRQHEVLESLVELPVSQWLFMIVLAVVLRACLVLEDWIRLWLFIGFGWSILFVTLAIRLKIAGIVQMVTPTTPRLCDVAHSPLARSGTSTHRTSANSMGLSSNDSLDIFLNSDACATDTDGDAAKEYSHRHRAISNLFPYVQGADSREA
eukprot:COSAG02_NODE_17265_length_1017_cov_1.162309_2_plen_271_part_01